MPRVYTRRDPAVRFWARVNKNGPIHPTLGTRCWLWSTMTPGQPHYGRVSIYRAGRKASVGAHCFAWELHNGPIPEGLFVCHRCDVRPCANPAHLFLGSQADNLRDAASKGRIYGQTKSHCVRGHPLTGENLVIRRGWRGCKTCQRERGLVRVHAKPGEMERKARMAREWRVANPAKAKAADARGVARRRERNRAKRLSHSNS